MNEIWQNLNRKQPQIISNNINEDIADNYKDIDFQTSSTKDLESEFLHPNADLIKKVLNST